MGKVILIGKSKLIVLAMLATIPMFGALNGQAELYSLIRT